MGDGAQVLAARVEDREATATAARVLAWLVERGVVEATPTDSGLGALAHRPGPNVLDVVVGQTPGVMDFRKLRTNGMHVEYSPRAKLVGGGDEMPIFACPSCKREAEADDVLPLLEELESLFAPPPQLECAACGVHSAVTDLVVTGGAKSRDAPVCRHTRSLLLQARGSPRREDDFDTTRPSHPQTFPCRHRSD